MSDKPTTAELITMLSEFDCHADVQKLASDRLDSLEYERDSANAVAVHANKQCNDAEDHFDTLMTRAEKAEATITALEADKVELAVNISEHLYKWMAEVKTNCPSGTLLSSAVLCDYAGKRGFINAMTTHIDELLSKQGPEQQ